MNLVHDWLMHANKEGGTLNGCMAYCTLSYVTIDYIQFIAQMQFYMPNYNGIFRLEIF